MKKISVIIPIYNVQEYIQECLQSVVDQTFKNLEIICVDDCSQDNSIEIAEKFAQKDSRIKIIKHTQNKGLGPARNTGIDNATGEYILFLDSDDYLKTDVLEHLYNNIVLTNSDIVFSKSFAFTELNDRKIQKIVKRHNKWLNYRETENFTVNIENYSDAISKISSIAWGKLYSMEFLKRNNIRFIDEKLIHEDNGFWLKICSQFPKISFIENVGVMYRMRENSIMTKNTNNKKYKHMQLVLADVFDYLKTNTDKVLSEFFIFHIKNADMYSKYFGIHFNFLFKFWWFENNKLVSILGIPLWREKQIKNKKKIRKILGVPVAIKLKEFHK